MKSIRKSLAEILTVLLVIGMLPVSPGRIITSAATDDTATESDALGDGLVAETEKTDVLPASKGTDSDAAFDQTVTVSGYTIRVTAEAGVFQEGSTLFAEEITDTGKKETINEKVSEEAGKETAALISFDIKVLDQSGNEMEPDLTKGEPVVTFGKVNAEKLTGQSDAKLEVYHLDDDLNSAEKLNAKENKTAETVTAETEHFSIFSIAPLSVTTTGTWVDDYTYSTDSNAVLTLEKYNGNKTTLNVPGSVTVDGTVYTIALNSTGGVDTNGIWHGQKDNITSLSFERGVILPADCSSMFDGCKNLTNLDISNFDTSDVTNMAYMFSSCSNLMNLDISHFNTANVSNMKNMFFCCYKLTSLDISHFNTANVKYMGRMFCMCEKLTGLDVRHFNTAKVESMGSMFGGCSGLTSLDVSGLNTENVSDISNMFEKCRSLTSLDVSRFNTAKVEKMDYMFSGCSGLTSLDVSGFNTAKVERMDYMFENCSGLTSLDLSSFDASTISKYSHIMGMLDDCNNLQSLWIPRNVSSSFSVSLPGTYYKVNSAGTETTESYTVLPVSQTTSFQIVKSGTTIPTSITVSFDSNGGKSTPSDQTISYGNTVTEPKPAPVKDGYVLSGWYRNKALITAWDFNNNTVGYPITLYAKWTEDPEVMITYKSADTSMGTVDPSSETIYQSMGVASGSDATALTRYHFVSWTDTDGAVVSKDSKLIPAKENGLNVMATYTANFALDTYTISFNANGHGTAPADEVGAYGYTVTEPAAPSETGYTFGGWYKEAACTNAWNFASDLVSGDMTLYAKWTKNTAGSTGSSGSGNSTSYTGQWVKNSIGWWYKNTDGTWPSNTWKQINGKWYHFNEKGYMQTGWILDNGKWYYLDPDTGAMVTGLLKAPDGYWYYFRTDGSMAVGDVTVDGTQRHFNDQVPPEPTYVPDPEKGTWVPNGSNTIPYGAEIK